MNKRLAFAIALSTVSVGISMPLVQAFASLSRSVPADGPRIIPFYRKIQSRELFDVDAFKAMRRNPPRNMSGGSASVVSPEIEIPVVVPMRPAAQTGSTRPLQMFDLSTTQRTRLQMYLRIGGCPNDADERFRLLCERLLRKQPPKEMKTGPRNLNPR